MKVSEHFTKREFEKSGTALRLGIDNAIKDHEHLMNLSSLCATVLEPIREKWGPMSISSPGTGTCRVSEAVGSSSKSSHCFAMAADFECFQALATSLFSTGLSRNQESRLINALPSIFHFKKELGNLLTAGFIFLASVINPRIGTIFYLPSRTTAKLLMKGLDNGTDLRTGCNTDT